MTAPKRPRMAWRPPRILYYEEQDQLEANARPVPVELTGFPVDQIQSIKRGRPCATMERIEAPGHVWERVVGRICPERTMNGLCTWNDGGLCRAHPPGECPIQTDGGC